MNEYSLWADLLNKFHTSPEWIQVLWLIAVPLLIFGLSWCLKEAVVAFSKRKQLPRGELVYSIYRNNDNELLVYRHAEALEQMPTNGMVLLPATEQKSEIQKEA